MSGIASDDFRDGVATGAFVLFDRLRTIESYGIAIDSKMIGDLVRGLNNEYGGKSRIEYGSTKTTTDTRTPVKFHNNEPVYKPDEARYGELMSCTCSVGIHRVK